MLLIPCFSYKKYLLLHLKNDLETINITEMSAFMAKC